LYNQLSAVRVHVPIFQQHPSSLNVVFFKKMAGTNPSIVFDDNENCD
jgi:hypothetical protein